jgi:hypothetical protein
MCEKGFLKSSYLSETTEQLGWNVPCVNNTVHYFSTSVLIYSTYDHGMKKNFLNNCRKKKLFATRITLLIWFCFFRFQSFQWKMFKYCLKSYKPD